MKVKIVVFHDYFVVSFIVENPHSEILIESVELSDMMDMRIAILANVSAFAGAITKSFSTSPWHLYLSSGLAMCSGLSSPVLRAVLSKAGQPQDAGNVKI